jgi:hypothetical protein
MPKHPNLKVVPALGRDVQNWTALLNKQITFTVAYFESASSLVPIAREGLGRQLRRPGPAMRGAHGYQALAKGGGDSGRNNGAWVAKASRGEAPTNPRL